MTYFRLTTQLTLCLVCSLSLTNSQFEWSVELFLDYDFNLDVWYRFDDIDDSPSVPVDWYKHGHLMNGSQTLSIPNITINFNESYGFDLLYLGAMANGTSITTNILRAEQTGNQPLSYSQQFNPSPPYEWTCFQSTDGCCVIMINFYNNTVIANSTDDCEAINPFGFYSAQMEDDDDDDSDGSFAFDLTTIIVFVVCGIIVCLFFITAVVYCKVKRDDKREITPINSNSQRSNNLVNHHSSSRSHLSSKQSMDSRSLNNNNSNNNKSNSKHKPNKPIPSGTLEMESNYFDPSKSGEFDLNETNPPPPNNYKQQQKQKPQQQPNNNALLSSDDIGNAGNGNLAGDPKESNDLLNSEDVILVEKPHYPAGEDGDNLNNIDNDNEQDVAVAAARGGEDNSDEDNNINNQYLNARPRVKSEGPKSTMHTSHSSMHGELDAAVMKKVLEVDNKPEDEPPPQVSFGGPMMGGGMGMAMGGGMGMGGMGGMGGMMPGMVELPNNMDIEEYVNKMANGGIDNMMSGSASSLGSDNVGQNDIIARPHNEYDERNDSDVDEGHSEDEKEAEMDDGDVITGGNNNKKDTGSPGSTGI